MMEEAEDDETVESFANRCQCRGDTFIAVVTAMRFSDTFHGEWVINVPFRRLSDLNFEGLDRIPENFQGFAMALHHRPDFWRDLERVRAELELEAFEDHILESNLAMVDAHTAVVDAYLSGELVLGRGLRQGSLDGGVLVTTEWPVCGAWAGRKRKVYSCAGGYPKSLKHGSQSRGGVYNANAGRRLAHEVPRAGRRLCSLNLRALQARTADPGCHVQPGFHCR